MLHRHFQRFVVFGAAILFIAYALATEDQQVARKADPDDDSTGDAPRFFVDGTPQPASDDGLGSGSPTSDSAGVPTLPAARARSPAATSIASSSRTVVDFPFVPVTAAIGTRRARPASSMSPQARRARRP